MQSLNIGYIYSFIIKDLRLEKRLKMETDKTTGKLRMQGLKEFWQSCNPNNLQSSNEGSKQPVYLHAICNTLGIGLEPTIKYLYTETPTFEQFENWIIENGLIHYPMINRFNSVVTNSRDEKFNEFGNQNQATILSTADLNFFEEHGYIILKSAIPADDCQKARQVIYNFINADENDPASWYKDHPAKQGIMVQLFSHDILDKIRMSEKIRWAYEQLWQRNDLVVSMDRVSFNPPENKNYHFPGPNLHWDVSLKRPIPFGLQGLLYLADTSEEQGAFTLIPGFHKKINSWLEGLPVTEHPRKQNLMALGPKPLAANAGDFIIWRQDLPHGSSPNTAKLPRIVQYINYQPIALEMQNEWI